MIQRALVRLLLAPFSLLYGLGVGLINLFYRQGLLKAITFDVPVISVGNLSVGGAGKTPHIEYLIRLLHEYVNLATLSRGYSRKTRGFLQVTHNMTAEEAGDEPLQFKRKFPDIMVTVAEDRAFAIPTIIGRRPDMQLILLDDAFQHRAVQPGLNILLTEYSRPFTRDWLLPSGRLREWRRAYYRADIIIVTKCPPDLTEEQARAMREEIKPQPHQQLFFSYYVYGNPYYIFDHRYRMQLRPEQNVLLISAIANTDYLMQYLEAHTAEVRAQEFADHHYFSRGDIGLLHQAFNNWDTEKKVILTTEKDAMRLELHREYLVAERLPIFALPVEVRFHFGEGERFEELIRQFLLNFKA